MTNPTPYKVREALDAEAFDNDLRHLALREDIDNIRQSYEDEAGHIQEEAVSHLRRKHAILRDALAAQDADFEVRALWYAADWLSLHTMSPEWDSSAIARLRSDADRQEKKITRQKSRHNVAIGEEPCANPIDVEALRYTASLCPSILCVNGKVSLRPSYEIGSGHPIDDTITVSACPVCSWIHEKILQLEKEIDPK